MKKLFLATAAFVAFATSANARDFPACNSDLVVSTFTNVTSAHWLVDVTNYSGPNAAGKRWCYAYFVAPIGYMSAPWQEAIFTIEWTDEATGRFWLQVIQRQVNRRFGNHNDYAQMVLKDGYWIPTHTGKSQADLETQRAQDAKSYDVKASSSAALEVGDTFMFNPPIQAWSCSSVDDLRKIVAIEPSYRPNPKTQNAKEAEATATRLGCGTPASQQNYQIFKKDNEAVCIGEPEGTQWYNGGKCSWTIAASNKIAVTKKR